eukprot:1795133-Rhodomonas_salina.1
MSVPHIDWHLSTGHCLRLYLQIGTRPVLVPSNRSMACLSTPQAMCDAPAALQSPSTAMRDAVTGY